MTKARSNRRTNADLADRGAGFYLLDAARDTRVGGFLAEMEAQFGHIMPNILDFSLPS